MTAIQTTTSTLDWQDITQQRIADFHAFATLGSVSFADEEARGIVAITLRLDGERALAAAQTLNRPPVPTVRRETITSVGVAEVLRPEGPYLLLRRGSEAWLVPDRPDGWDLRQPWFGDIESIRWIGGLPARTAFRRVGAPVNG